MNIDEIAEKIATDLFILGNEIGSPTHRIQFIGGEYPDIEKAQGGLNKEALTKKIRESLSEVFL